MALLSCCSKFSATAEPMHAAPWVCRRFRLDAALRLRWSSMYLDRIAVVRCEEYITCAMGHRTGTQSYKGTAKKACGERSDFRGLFGSPLITLGASSMTHSASYVFFTS